MTIANLWRKFLSRIIPKGLKRTMVLVAVFVEIERERGEQNPRLEGLNAQLHLVQDDTVLHRIADLTNALFASVTCPVRKDAGLIENCSNAIRWLPSWLWYGERSEILSDLAEVAACNIDQLA